MVDLIANRFSMGKIIGKGGMGTVYLGVDTLTQNPVAIKILKPDVVHSDPTIVERFEREGEMLRRLNHPNIVKVLATDSTDDLHVIVMEYIEGGSLQDRLKETPQMPIEDVLNMALDLTDALIRAHRLDIIHRDIKPANVLIGQDEIPLLTDFGVAHMEGATQVTETGIIVGTLAYLPPEALSGEAIDERADIWAFGVMLFEMLAGERPFTGQSAGGVINSILNKPTPDLFDYRDDTPWTLLGLVYWMLEKDREKRPESFRFIGAMIENIMSGKDLPINWFGTGDNTEEYTPGHVYMTEEVPEITDDLLEQILSKQAEGTPTNILSAEEVASDDDISSETESWQADPPISRSDWQVLSKKQLDHPVRIFISYRRADSIAVTGRIYDRLVMAFGAENVFKDMEAIPVGADFREVINSAVTNCDVELAIIGREWLAMENENGRRLDDPNDFVRIEIESGLQNEQVLVIPVLVGNAPMPSPKALPESLRPLVYRHSASIRNDPDFNRDSEWLINQIHNSFEIKKQRQMVPLFIRGLGGIFATLVIFALVIFGIQPIVPNTTSTNVPLIASNSPSIEPVSVAALSSLDCDLLHVEATEYLVAVMMPTNRTGAGDDQRSKIVRDEIVRDLKRNLETGVSNIRITACNDTVTSETEARTKSKGTGIHIMLWGSYDDSSTTMTVQTGDPLLYTHQPFPTDQFERFTQADFRADRIQGESFVFPVLSTLNMAHTHTGELFDLARNIYIARELSNPQAQILEVGGVVDDFHQFAFAYFRDEDDTAVNIIDNAIGTQRNPILLIARSLAYQRLNQIREANDDITLAETRADQLGIEGWITPKMSRVANLLLLEDAPDFEQAKDLLDDINEMAPDNWFAHTYRGAIAYLERDYDRAKIETERAIANNPSINYPYGTAAGIALRRLDFVALDNALAAASRFDDADIAEAVVRATYGGDAANNALIQVISAFAPFIIGDWNTTIENTQYALGVGITDVSDIHFLRGVALCAMGDLENDENAKNNWYADAEAAFTAGVELEDDFTLIYLLRAYVRQQQGKLLPVLEDTGRIAQDENFGSLSRLYQEALVGNIDCARFTSIDFSQYAPSEDDNE